MSEVPWMTKVGRQYVCGARGNGMNLVWGRKMLNHIYLRWYQKFGMFTHCCAWICLYVLRFTTWNLQHHKWACTNHRNHAPWHLVCIYQCCERVATCKCIGPHDDKSLATISTSHLHGLVVHQTAIHLWIYRQDMSISEFRPTEMVRKQDLYSTFEISPMPQKATS